MIPKTSRYPRLLTIAGSDSGGGAGIQADLKTFSALGCYGMSAITALTAQNTTGVRAIHAIPAQMLRDQIDAVIDDIGVDAVKIGMLHAPDIVQVVADAIDRHQLGQVVLDPVMIATSGAVLIENEAVQALVQQLFHRVQLITPNLDEAGFLVGRTLKNEDDMEAAADQLLGLGALAV
ncbi:MAG: bifunctional hydroxymethylpyrimidine kinase/phosphomethylpyrimidine kinase, partial [Limnohabitans sp.]|nr:bifunctional hydroxymethylpyrimidine kinase/phosphomethylpyrimidine kinase [Limnohabitans sp.]